VTAAKRDLDLPLLVTIAVLVVILLGVGVVFLQAWYHHQAAAEITRKVIEPPVTELADHLAPQADALAHYRWLDREQGEVRLPVTRAMELVVQESAQEAARQTSPSAAEVTTRKAAEGGQ
jgi:hypothetical protein